MDFVIPDDILCAKTHEWINENGVCGITDVLVEQLGDIFFVELPEIGSHFLKNESVMTIKSVKGVNEIFAPVSGEIVDINDDLIQNPDIINEDMWLNGWLFKIKPDNFKEDTNDLVEYEDYLEEFAN